MVPSPITLTTDQEVMSHHQQVEGGAEGERSQIPSSGSEEPGCSPHVMYPLKVRVFSVDLTPYTYLVFLLLPGPCSITFVPRENSHLLSLVYSSSFQEVFLAWTVLVQAEMSPLSSPSLLMEEEPVEDKGEGTRILW